MIYRETRDKSNTLGEDARHRVRELRELYYPGWARYDVGKEYGVDVRPLYQVFVFSDEERKLVEALKPGCIVADIRQYANVEDPYLINA